MLFDLGNTLAAYYRPEQFGPILERCVAAVIDELQRRGLRAPDFACAMEAARCENREASDFSYSPMAERIVRIFGAAPEDDECLLPDLCARFLDPVFAVGRIYDDTLPALRAVRQAGYLTAIVSNAPWGSPPELWRTELARLGLAAAVDAVVLCGDVGWRKPAPQIFRHASARLGVRCEDCLFVGDELQWDVQGSAAVGMRPVLIDRDDLHPDHRGARIRDLRALDRFLRLQGNQHGLERGAGR